jgi:hypothetical protein
MSRKNRVAGNQKKQSPRNRPRPRELALCFIETRKFKRSAPISIRVGGQLDGGHRYGAAGRSGGQFALEQRFPIDPATPQTADISAAGRAGNNVRSAAGRSRSSGRAPGWGAADEVEKFRAGSNPVPRVCRDLEYPARAARFAARAGEYGLRFRPTRRILGAGGRICPQAPNVPAGLGFLRSYLASLIFLANPIFESSQMP